MDEATWLSSDDPWVMRAWLLEPGIPAGSRGEKPTWPPGDRKLRLFACGCCRRSWHRFPDERSRQAVLVAERFADGLATQEERSAARSGNRSGFTDPDDAKVCCAESAVHTALYVLRDPTACPPAEQAKLFRCVFGNPFRPVRVRREWLTPTVLGLARAAYDERDEDGLLDNTRLGVLSDALEDSGCPSQELYQADDGWGVTDRRATPLLAHLRGPGPHARGCWPLDLILGKE